MTALASVYRICSYSYSVHVHDSTHLFFNAYMSTCDTTYVLTRCVHVECRLYGTAIRQGSALCCCCLPCTCTLNAVIMAHVSRVVAALWPVFLLGLLGVLGLSGLLHHLVCLVRNPFCTGKYKTRNGTEWNRMERNRK